MHPLLKTVYTSLKYFIAPPFCAYCTYWLSDQKILCQSCRDNIQLVVSTSLALTPAVSMQVFALSPYQDPLQSLILAKAQSNRLVSKQLGELLCQMMPNSWLAGDYIVPIPLHWTRYAYRGYNQAEVMASVIAQKNNKPLMNLLTRNRRTSFQSTLSGEQRKQNLEDAFELCKNSYDQKLVQGKHILLVDDLLTTGATIRAAAKKLLVLKPSKISVVVACRTI